MNNALERCRNIEDLRNLAQRRIQKLFFDFIERGADDETTVKRNLQAYEQYDLIPRALIDVGQIETTTEVQGQSLKLPVINAPTDGSRLFHHQGERAVARAAARVGTLYSLAMFGTVGMEDIALVSQGPKLFQLYPLHYRAISLELAAPITRQRVARPSQPSPLALGSSMPDTGESLEPTIVRSPVARP